MSNKPPTTMKAMQRISQRPMVQSDRLIANAGTLDRMHARELERRSTVQRIPGPKPSVDRGPK